MEVFRIFQESHANNLTSSGGENRWNKRGQKVIYTGSSRSLSTLELVVHKSAIVPKVPYKVMVISIADDDNLVRQIRINELRLDWRTLAAYSTLQNIGADWYDHQETLLLKVPSAIIPYEYNYVINTEHPDFLQKIQLIRIEDYFWDDRLL
ncbi:MAG: RES family NAD+ phosphorylase [Bacteroidetes bacterium]|nr:RES family NAD+ phosphorylase [Bacteroidota bacterium]